jgi:hypothetical protein
VSSAIAVAHHVGLFNGPWRREATKLDHLVEGFMGDDRSAYREATAKQFVTRAAGSGGASYEVKKESNPHAHAKKDGNREDGDGGVLRLKLIPDVHAV